MNVNKHQYPCLCLNCYLSTALELYWIRPPNVVSSPADFSIFLKKQRSYCVKQWQGLDGSDAYGAWGLGTSSLLHVLDPRALSNVFALQKSEGIAVRPTESGSRWQTAGSYAIDQNNNVRWGGPARRADSVPDFEDAAQALNG